MTGSPQPRLRVVDLFCGAGGLSEGFRQAGYDVVAGSDHDPDAIATYALNFPEAAALCGDIRNPDLRALLDAHAQQADVLVGGPPCQAFSQVRNHSRLIDDPRNSLYREFVSAVAAARPQGFVMENVPGMAQMGVQEQVLEDLGLGGAYRVRPQLVDAVDFGVPQTRKRLLFLGVRADLGTEPPALAGSGAAEGIQLVRFAGTGSPDRASGYAVAARPDEAGELLGLRLADPLDTGLVTAEQAIGDLAGLRAGRREDALTASELPAPASAYQEVMRRGHDGDLQNTSVPRMRADTSLRLAGVPEGGNHRDLAEHLRARYLTEERWGPSNGSGQLGRQHFYAYRRLHPDYWAWTLNTKGDSVYHYRQTRCLSVREFARLQSFPDRFFITVDPRRGLIAGRVTGGAGHSRYRQVGNAVPVLLARAAAEALRDALAPTAQLTVPRAQKARAR